MKRLMLFLVAGSSLATIPQGAFAQASATAAAPQPEATVTEIVVTARRRNELVENVPQTVNAVSGATLEKLNIQKFEDVQATVPGLSLTSGASGYSTAATIRGAPFQVESGASPTVEFYLNDALIQSNYLFQSTFDVGQMEVLRGPQGTLRGRASPSGSITVTTRRPILSDFGGSIATSLSNQHAYNTQGALNIPIIRDKLALRVAGVWDDNELDQVRSINAGFTPYAKSRAGRVTLRFEPTEAFDATVMYQKLNRKMQTADQLESISQVDPAVAPTGRIIRSTDRLAIVDAPRTNRTKQEVITGQANWRIAGQQLSYVGSYTDGSVAAKSPMDAANVFANFEYFQDLQQNSIQKTHEVRLSSVDSLFGWLSYTVGAFHSELGGGSNIAQQTLVALNGRPLSVVTTPAVSVPDQKETSYFGNLTAHLSSGTEISGGIRRISMESNSSVFVNGLRVNNTARKNSPTVYNLSVSHRFNEHVLAYANTGKSWRGGPFLVGVFQALSPRLEQFLNLAPEQSKSYEAGVKTNFFNRRMRAAIAVYHQDFDGFIYRGPSVPYANTTNAGLNVQRFFFGSNLPAKIDGVDLDFGYQFTPQLSLSGGASYAKSRITGGRVACFDGNGDGRPDAPPSSLTVEQLVASAGGQAVGACNASGRLATTPPWTLTLQPEYNRQVRENVDVFARGLITVNAKNAQDEFNPYDDVGAYALVNAYAGIRDASGAWELSLFVKNLTNSQKVLSRTGFAVATNYQALQPPTFRTTAPVTAASSYLNIRTVPDREVGISLRYAFGSR